MIQRSIICVAVLLGISLVASTQASGLYGLESPLPLADGDIPPNCRLFIEGSRDRRVISSPNYPGQYPNSTDCVTILQAPHGQQVELDILTFDLEDSGGGCKQDYLEIRDGPFAYSETIDERLCGRLRPRVIRAKGRYMWLRFRSDDSVQYGGFTATYSFRRNASHPVVSSNFDVRTKSCLVPIDTSRSSGYVNSTYLFPAEAQDYSRKYEQALDCAFDLQASRGSRIILSSLKLTFPKPKACGENQVVIYDRTTTPSDPHQSHCSVSEVPGHYMSSHSRLLVRVYGSEADNLPAISFSYTVLRTVETCQKDDFRCNATLCVPLDFKCDGQPNCPGGEDEAETLCSPKPQVDSEAVKKGGMDLKLIVLGVAGALVLVLILVSVYVTLQYKRRHLKRRRQGKSEMSGSRGGSGLTEPFTATTVEMRPVTNGHVGNGRPMELQSMMTQDGTNVSTRSAPLRSMHSESSWQGHNSDLEKRRNRRPKKTDRAGRLPKTKTAPVLGRPLATDSSTVSSRTSSRAPPVARTAPPPPIPPPAASPRPEHYSKISRRPSQSDLDIITRHSSSDQMTPPPSAAVSPAPLMAPAAAPAKPPRAAADVTGVPSPPPPPQHNGGDYPPAPHDLAMWPPAPTDLRPPLQNGASSPPRGETRAEFHNPL